MALEIELVGVQELQAALQRLGDQAKPLAARALLVEAETIMADSKQMTPVDTGVLRSSGHVLPPAMDRDGVEVRLGYGGAAEAYAIVQHERLDYTHTVGGPKFLERPLMEAARGMAQRLANAFRDWR